MLMWLVFCFLLSVSGILLWTSVFSMDNKLLPCWIFQWIGNLTLTVGEKKSHEFVFIDMLYFFVFIIYKGVTKL